MKILALETSCDETAAAVVEKIDQGMVKILSNVVVSSLDEHAKTGGIIPEIAARKQVEYIIPVIKQALQEANLQLPDSSFQIPAIDAIAVTYGPGLIGSLLIGVETAKILAYVWNKPIIPVNHLYGHIYANFLMTNDLRPTTVAFPALALVVSGGHTDLVLIKKHGTVELLGGTLDDAAGECFDKCARLLGYAYPGGPKISDLAKKGNPKAFHFPRPMLGSGNFDFSFSGLKTAFLREVTRQRHPERSEGSKKILRVAQNDEMIDNQTIADLSASLQKAIVDVLIKKTILAAEKYNVKSILLGGGVSANQLLRDELQKMITSLELRVKMFVPPPNLCTDNAAMIGAAAVFNYEPTDWQTLTANPELYFD